MNTFIKDNTLPSVDESLAWWNVHSHHLQPGNEPYTIVNAPVGEPTNASHISLSIHPWHLTEENFPQQWQQLQQAVSDGRVVAIGEAGLDKLVDVPFDLQLKVFERVAALASEMQLPLVIHAVKSANELLAIKKKLHPSNPWIIHGFRGKPQLAHTYLQHGCYLSYGERYQPQALQTTPLDRLLLETDESVLPIAKLYQQAAQWLQMPVDTLRKQVENNVHTLFIKV